MGCWGPRTEELGEGLPGIVGKGLGEGLARGWRRVGKGFPCTLQLCNSQNACLEERVCDSMGLPSASQPIQFASRSFAWSLAARSKYVSMSHCVMALFAHDCGYPLSRCTCRATRVATDFLHFRAFCRCSSGVAPHPLKILASHLSPPHSREVSH